MLFPVSDELTVADAACDAGESRPLCPTPPRRGADRTDCCQPSVDPVRPLHVRWTDAAFTVSVRRRLRPSTNLSVAAPLTLAAGQSCSELWDGFPVIAMVLVLILIFWLAIRLQD